MGTRFQPFVACNTVDSRYRARPYTGVAGSCIGRQVRNEGLLAGEPVTEQPLKTIIAISVRIPVEIVPAHLVYHNADDKLRPGRFAGDAPERKQ
jgi:hypothetical protein